MIELWFCHNPALRFVLSLLCFSGYLRIKIVSQETKLPNKLAVFGIEAALKILSGEGQPEDKKTPVDLVTKESL